jgi:crescentin
LREENRRFDERLVAAEKRIIALESDITAARQRLLIADDEKRAQHTLLDKAGVEAARLSRKVTETEASFNAVQGRLRHAEASINEASIERARLVTTLDELNERHERERAGQNMRFDSLQSRAATLEKVVADARELLLARAEQIREYDRRNGEVATERNELQERVSNLQAALIEYESKYKEADQTRSAYMERNGALARALTAKEAALAQAEDANASLTDRVGALETARAGEKQTAEQKITELDAALRREKLDRAVVEGALATARKDFSRAMREVMALQRNPPAPAEPARPRAANAA